MALHIPTLLIVSIFIFCLMGLLTVHAWSRKPGEHTLLYLGCTMLLAALGLTLVSLRGLGADAVPFILGNVVLLLSASMNWTAMRVFVGKRPSMAGIFAGAVIWLVLCAIPTFYETLATRVMAYSILAACYGLLTSLEFWGSRKRLEVSCTPALVLTLLHTLFYCVRASTDQGLPLNMAISDSGEGVSFFSFMLFESMLYVIGIAYVTLVMVKERAELKLTQAAYCDPLTGIGNRRAFMRYGERMLEQAQQRDIPVTLLLCDLDHFKRLNDAFGHQTGDQALIAFSQITSQNLRQHDVFARIGGEEFACLLTNTDEHQALQIAERIRSGFSALPLLEPGLLSVSIGVVTTDHAGYELSRLLCLADEALYEAKGQGRNRVQPAAPQPQKVAG